jgi:ketosteroid isomerase-like protein
VKSQKPNLRLVQGAKSRRNLTFRGRAQFVESVASFALQMFPNGISFQFVSALADGEEVAVQAESKTVAFNGRDYTNCYHYYFRFAGDKLAHVRDYCATGYARETLMS